MSDGRPAMRDGFRMGLVLFGAILAVFSLFRLALFLRYRESFAGVRGIEVALAFLDGVRFDLSITALVAGVPILMLLLPVSRRWWVTAWAMLAAEAGILLCVLLCADHIYFGQTGRHVGEELISCWGDTAYMITITRHYWPVLVALTAAIAAVPWWIVVFVRRRFEKAPARPWRAAAVFVTASALLVLANRGVLRGKPLRPIDAFSGGRAAYGNLALNGAFSSVHASRNVGRVSRRAASEREIAAAAAAVVCPWETVPVPECPLQRRVRDEDRSVRTNRWNVVLVILESFGSEYVETITHNGYNISPNLDTLATNGTLFTRFYANGHRSTHGWAGILLSVPCGPGLPHLGGGLEVANVHRMGVSMARNGYRTIAANSGARQSFRVESIVSLLGFGEYAGKEDFRKRQRVEEGRPLPSFGWDYDAYMYLLDAIDAKPDPFIAVMVAGTAHAPCCVPDRTFEKFPHVASGKNGFLNVLYYSDWALGAFMAEARKRAWFDRTVFVITSDHTAFGKDAGVEAMFGIPLILLIPGARSAVSDRVASQVDIWPTLVDILGLPDAYSGLGRSLMRPVSRSFALLEESGCLVIVTPDGWMRHSRAKRLDSSLRPGVSTGEADRMEELALTLDRSLLTLFARNRFFRE